METRWASKAGAERRGEAGGGGDGLVEGRDTEGDVEGRRDSDDVLGETGAGRWVFGSEVGVAGCWVMGEITGTVVEGRGA